MSFSISPDLHRDPPRLPPRAWCQAIVCELPSSYAKGSSCFLLQHSKVQRLEGVHEVVWNPSSGKYFHYVYFSMTITFLCDPHHYLYPQSEAYILQAIQMALQPSALYHKMQPFSRSTKRKTSRGRSSKRFLPLEVVALRILVFLIHGSEWFQWP